MLGLQRKIERRINYLDKAIPPSQPRSSIKPSPGAAADAKALSPYEWASAYRRIDDKAFSLDKYKPLKEIYCDPHPFRVVTKPVQKGLSELAVSFAIWSLVMGAQYWRLEKTGLNVGYCFPTKSALSDFSKERISGLKRESDYFKKLFTEFDDVTFKQAGDSYLYLRGAWSEDALVSFPADVLILDEYDHMDSSAIALAEKRLSNSEVKRKLYLSKPSLPGRGIHALYMQSDQRVWEIECVNCHAWTEIDFFRDVKADGEGYETWQYYAPEQLRRTEMSVTCPECHSPLDRLSDGRWTAKQPDIEGIRGYHVPALCFPSVSLNELAVNATSTDPSQVTEFFRSDLGLPYEAAGSRVTDAMLGQLSHELENGLLPSLAWSDTTMGVDVGGRHHFRISSKGPDGRRYIRKMGAVKTWVELDTLLDQYKVRRCVIDALPELHACEAWASKHQGRVIRAFYPNAANLNGQLFQPDADKIEDVVRINRTMAMDAVYSNIAAAKEIWPASIHNDPEVIAHMKAPVRVVVEDAHGQERATWEHTSPDHLFHASVYDVIAGETLAVKEQSYSVF
jgi:hypothetical protein